MTRFVAYTMLAVVVAGHSAPPAAETVAPNDNRQSVGKLVNGVLTVALEARTVPGTLRVTAGAR